MYDAAIIGSGPAAISAALTLKLHNKDIIWFGTKKLSNKIERSEVIANYPGLPMISGTDLNKAFNDQIEQAGLEITEKMVTKITSSRRGFMVLADNDIYDAKTVLLALGSTSPKGLPGEDELLGHGVSYCATCDGFLYKDKEIAVFCGDKRFEHEVKYLAELAGRVYLYASYPDCEIDLDNVTKLAKPIRQVTGSERVEGIKLTDGSYLEVDGVFFLRNAVAPGKIVNGLAMDESSIVTDRQMATNKKGCYAAGDCTGRPFQITKAVGEGNVAAHSILEYLAQLEKNK